VIKGDFVLWGFQLQFPAYPKTREAFFGVIFVYYRTLMLHEILNCHSPYYKRYLNLFMCFSGLSRFVYWHASELVREKKSSLFYSYAGEIYYYEGHKTLTES